MTTIEILQAAIDDQCDIEIETWSSGICAEINGKLTCGWAGPMPTLETAVQEAWQHYQTNKNQ